VINMKTKTFTTWQGNRVEVTWQESPNFTFDIVGVT
jgi:hypothetical protein